MKHPHHAVILAYLDDKEIEFRSDPGSSWELVGKWKKLGHFPSFYPEYEYRIKPTPKHRLLLQGIDNPEKLAITGGWYASGEEYSDLNPQSGYKVIQKIECSRKDML